MRTTSKIISLTALAMMIQGCGDQVGPELTPPPPPSAQATALFSPADGANFIPFPLDLFFSGTADGSINIPGAGENPAFAAMNTMDGFSTTAPMVVRFSAPIDDPTDPDDIKNGVLVFEADQFDPGAQGSITVNRQLIWGVDYVAGVSGGVSLLIQPTKPLASGKTHIVVITDALKSRAGVPVQADDTYSLLKGAFLLSPAVVGTGGVSDFVLQDDGDPCVFSEPASVAICTDVNTDDYLTASAVPGAEAAAGIAGALAQLEAGGALAAIYQLEQLRRVTAKHLDAVAAAPVPVDAADVSLSYSISTQTIGAALAAAKVQVDAADAPTLSVLNPITLWGDDNPYPFPIEVTSPGPDGNPATPDHLAHIYLGTMSGALQFLDPEDVNGGKWEALEHPANWAGVLPCTALPAVDTGSSNLVGCNGFNPVVQSTDYGIPMLISAPRPEVMDGTLALAVPGAPDCSAAGDLPVVIYQHGIPTSRATLLALADSLANACAIGIAIDLPKHGILPENDPFGASLLAQLYQGLQQANGISPPTFERLVRVANPLEECSAKVGVPAGDGNFYCPTGDNFINLANLANARDGLRQAVTDLHSLFRALEENGASLSAAIGAPVDTANIHLVGMSLGGMVGSVFAANEDGLATLMLNTSGGGIAKILDGSPSFEPVITAGLFDAAGLVKPSGAYEGFLIMAQTLVDNTDPINFTSQLATTGTPILMQEVVGDLSNTTACVLNGVACPDLTVPNNVFGSSFGPAWGLVSQSGQQSFLPKQNFVTTPVALAGTDPFAQGTGFVIIGGAVQAGALPVGNALTLGPLGGDAVAGAPVTFKGLGLQTVGSCGTVDGAGASGIVRFVAGSHGSLLSPASSLAVTKLMQTQMATFVGSQGMVIAEDDTGNLVFDPPVASASVASCP